jgi:hypothetical protein
MRDAFIEDAKDDRMYQPRPMPVPDRAKRVASQTSHLLRQLIAIPWSINQLTT